MYDTSGMLLPNSELKELIIHGEGFVQEPEYGQNKIWVVWDNAHLGAEVFNKFNPYLYGALSEDGKTLSISPSYGLSEVDIKPGSYELYVTNIYGKSNSVNLTIEEPATPAITKILAPRNGDVWKRDQTYAIEWKSRHISSVDIALTNLVPIYTDCGPRINTPGNEGVPIPKPHPEEKCAHYNGMILFENTPADGTEQWKIPLSLTPGTYSISINSNPNNGAVIKIMEGNFKIV
mgnify:CR=1 FL=1